MTEEKDYDGPYIEQRIEWKCPDRKRHNVVLFGSWNRFKGGDELEYQGKQIFAANVKLPLGNYVYRFLIDGEEWETNNGTQKTVRDGIEYNTINVKEDDNDTEDDESEDENEQQNKKNNGLMAPNNALQKQTSRVIFDEKKGGFVVGQAPVGKKRRGRASMELDLGRNFDDEEVEQENDDGGKNETTEGGDNNTANGDSVKKKRRRRRRKDKNGMPVPAKDMQQEKEWARYVFVQQLRQQQQHNDEINRVKTLWKQERQVRVEMHKKVVKNLKQSKKDNQVLQLEIQNLKKQLDIRAGGDKKRVSELSDLNTQLEDEKKKLMDEKRKLEDDLNELRKNAREKLQINAAKSSDFSLERKKYETEIETLKTEISSLKARNDSLQSNIETIKSGNTKTMDYQQKQFEEREQQLEQEKKEKDTLKDQIKSLKKEKSELTDENEKINKDIKNEQKKIESLNKKIKKLQDKNKEFEKTIDDIKNSNEAAEKTQKEIEKITKEKDGEISKINDKNKSLEKKLEEMKNDYESQIEGIKKKASEDMAVMSSKNDDEQNQHINKLKEEMNEKDKKIKELSDSATSLQEKLTESKSANDTSNKKNEEMKINLDELTNEKDKLTDELTKLKSEFDKITEEYKTSKENSESSNKDLVSQIDSLKDDINKLKTKISDEEKINDEKSKSYEQQIETLKKNINDKGAETLEMTKELTETKQELDNSKNELKSANDKIDSLNNQIQNNKEINEEQLSKLKASNEELVGKLNKIEEDAQNEKRKLEDELQAEKDALKVKLEEFNNAEMTIKELKDKVEFNEKKFELEKKDYEDKLKVANSKGEKISKACKGIINKFGDLKKQLKDIKDEQIEQLEELQGFFDDFDDLLPKVFKFNQAMIDDLLNKYKRELSLRRKYFNMVQDLRGNIRVFCRVRPLLPFELKKNATSCLKFPHEGALVITDDKGTSNSFEFDHVYKPGTSQETVSEDSTEYIQSVLDGYNVSIFAYGQTGSGKTYTMDGEKNDPGVNIRGLAHLFKLTQERKPQFEYKIKVAIFEIYNTKIRDLLSKVVNKGKKKKDKKKEEFKVRHLPDGTVDIPGLSWKRVNSDKDVQDIADAAKKERSAGVTDMNAHSSRSHMLLVVDANGVNIPANITYQGRLYLVDLAGSERVKKSGATGDALKEAQAINSSLAALGNVISALQRKEKFIPYRDSTLTSVMANAIGGNAKTIMFLNCCPTAAHAFETLSSLKFGLRVGKVELGAASQNKGSTKSKKKKDKDKK